jgi:hypothetical protein
LNEHPDWLNERPDREDKGLRASVIIDKKGKQPHKLKAGLSILKS